MLWAALPWVPAMRQVHISVIGYIVCTDIHAHALSIWLSILNKVRKTNPFGAGVTLYLKNNLCPVSAMLAYPAVRPKSPGLLFMFDDGSTLSRDKLVALLHQALSA